MKVYALTESYCNGVEEWSNIIDLYSNHDDAHMKQIQLEQDQDPSDKKSTSWYVTEMRVL